MTKIEFYAYKEQAFNKFCYTVIKHEGINAIHEKARRIRNEINFSSVAPAILEQLSADDRYDIESRVFYVQSIIPILVIDGLLAEALSLLVNPLREVVLLHYFLDLKLPDIALLLKIPYSTVKYRLAAALARLKDILESLTNEE